MMQTYADFDMKSLGCYGYYPLHDVSHTCYSTGTIIFSNLVGSRPSPFNAERVFASLVAKKLAIKIAMLILSHSSICKI
jgi:hypothetical protein